jgi:hypothetical protein
MSKRFTATTNTTQRTTVVATVVTKQSYADKFLDQRAHAEIAVDLENKTREIDALHSKVDLLNKRLEEKNSLKA